MEGTHPGPTLAGGGILAATDLGPHGDEARLLEALGRFGLQGDPRMVVGAPAAEIVGAAKDLGAELIVIGTRGRTGLKWVLLGSVAEAVVRNASCPVLVMRLFPGPVS